MSKGVMQGGDANALLHVASASSHRDGVEEEEGRDAKKGTLSWALVRFSALIHPDSFLTRQQGAWWRGCRRQHPRAHIGGEFRPRDANQSRTHSQSRLVSVASPNLSLFWQGLWCFELQFHLSA